MDFFNFLYKLSNIFTNKRRLKFFIVVGLIILLIFASNKGVFASTPQDDLTIMNYQMVLQQTFTNYLRYWQKNKPTDTYTDGRFDTILNRIMFNSVYCTAPTGDPNTELWVYTYIPNSTSYANNPNIFTTDGSYSVGLNSGTEIDCKLGLITPNCFIRLYIGNGTLQVEYNLQNLSDFYMPSACYMVRSTSLDDLLKDFGKYSTLSTTYNTSDEELQALTSAGFSSVNNNIQQQTNTITNSIATTNNELSEANDNLNSINDEVSATNDFLNDNTVDDSIVSLPTENNQDLTSGFFSGLLNTFYDNFNRGGIQAIQISIPFTNKKFNVNSAYIKTMVENNEKFATLVVIVQDFWWFALGYYVLIDIYKKINAIKSGDITNIENENISTSLL